MDKKLTFWGATGFVVLYFVAVFAAEFIGFAHPVSWYCILWRYSLPSSSVLPIQYAGCWLQPWARSLAHCPTAGSRFAGISSAWERCCLPYSAW